jgi:ATP-dependent phosphofructokinase / diphosphate-dependent phosphofructokinase
MRSRPSDTMKIGILNGGGDCAGLNSVTRAVLKAADIRGDTVVGIRSGWAGLLDGRFKEIRFNEFEDSIGVGGSMLTTSRTNPLKKENGLDIIKKNMKKAGIDVLIAVGGDDTLGIASRLSENGVKIIGIPKTIDNDLMGTDYSFGFFTAVDEATRLIESLATTGRSHERVMVVEVMGRDAGWITAFAGMAAGANMILVPEFETSLGSVVELVKKRYESGKRNAVIVVAEGVKLGYKGEVEKDEFGHKLNAKAEGQSNSLFLARYIEQKTGFETRAAVLGHTIRGTPPNAYDRLMTTMLGYYSVEAIHAGRNGIMVAVRGTEIVEVPLSEGSRKKYLDAKTWKVARSFFG